MEKGDELFIESGWEKGKRTGDDGWSKGEWGESHSAIRSGEYSVL